MLSCGALCLIILRDPIGQFKVSSYWNYTVYLPALLGGRGGGGGRVGGETLVSLSLAKCTFLLFRGSCSISSFTAVISPASGSAG